MIMVQERKITLDDISRDIDSGLNTTDQQRVAALERLQIVRKAKATGLKKEYARVSIKYGADHPRVQALAAKVELNQGLVNDLVIETIKAKIEIPVVDEATWVLHGFVRDRSRNGLPDLTIALYDGRGHEGNWLRDLGYACTDEKGYFRLTVRDFKSRETPAYVGVLNSKSVSLYRDSQPLTPKGGEVDYREIIIGEEARSCAPPTRQPSDSVPGGKGQPANVVPTGKVVPPGKVGLAKTQAAKTQAAMRSSKKRGPK